MSLEQALQVRRHPQRLAHVLLHEQHGEPGRQDLRQHGVDAPDDYRGQAEGKLIEQQHARVGDQRPADGHGLLLAARQLRRELGPAVPHPVEYLVNALDRPRSFPRVRRADLQVLLDRERSEQPPTLRHHGDALGGPALGPDLGHVPAVEQDRALGRVVQAGDRAQQRRFARAVRADDRVHIAGEYPQRYAVQGAQLAMVHREIADLEQCCPARLRGAFKAPPSLLARSSLLSPGGAAPLRLARVCRSPSLVARALSPVRLRGAF